MAARLIIAPEAELDLAEGFAWYEKRRAGWPLVHESDRSAPIRRFPFAIFYEYAGVEVMIYAVFHTSRDPEKWRRRLP